MDIANVEMFEAWNGQEGDDWTENAARYEGSGRRHRPHLINPSIIATGDRVLDIGCGTGRSAIEAASSPPKDRCSGSICPRRCSPTAWEQAAAESITNVTFVQGDAQVHPFEAVRPTSLSATTAHVLRRPDRRLRQHRRGPAGGWSARAARVARAPGQRVAHHHPRRALRSARELGTPPPDAPTPFSLADPDRVQARLTAAGFSEIRLEPVDEPMEMGADADESFAFFKDSGIVRGLLDGVDDVGRAEGLDNLHTAFKEAETPEGVLLGSACWLITATAA